MRKSKKKVLFVALVGVLLLVVVVVIFKFRIFADANLPSWVDSATASKYNSVWTTTQKQPFTQCISEGLSTKSTLTTQEANLFGSASVAFNISSGKTVPQTDPNWQYYQYGYRMIVTPLKYAPQTDGTTLAKLKITLFNNSQAPIIVGNPEARYYFWSLDTQVPKWSNVIFTRGEDYTYTLMPGEYVSRDTLELKLTNPAYWGVEFSSWLFTLNNGTPTFAQPVWSTALQRTDSLVSCIINPMPISSIAPATSVVPSPIPSATTTTSAIGGNRDVTFHKGFNAFGNPGTVSGDLIGGQGMYLYRFNGPSNSWQYYPKGGDNFYTQTPEGSYVYNPGDAKTVRFMVGSTTVNTYQLKKGWNMLWTMTDKTLSDLSFYYDNQTSSAQAMINSGAIMNNIFIIDNDQASASCSYFKLLSTTNSNATCSGSGLDGLGRSSKIPGQKNFWVYVN